MNTNEFYIQRCLELAKKGLGTTYPNPLVGCVVVHDNKIIGEGWHIKAGDEHAEVRAIKAVKNQKLLKTSTLYVTLEPCSHYGKTPPCSDLIVEKKIPHIVIGTIDPFAKVSGLGMKKLLAAGRKVTLGVGEEECEKLNKRFFTFHRKKRPYVILKWAETQHGFMAPEKQAKGDIFWITNPYSQQLVHKWRSEEQAILVGTTTALMDNPQLNVRHWQGENPTRVVIDKSLQLSDSLSLLDQTQPTVVFHEDTLSRDNSRNLTYIGLNFEKNFWLQVCNALYELHLQSIIIEGGYHTLKSLIEEDMWDEARVFVGQNLIDQGLKAPKLDRKATRSETIKGDTLNYYYND